MRASSPHRARTPAPRRRPALFGLLALTVIDWTHAPGWIAHLSSAGGLAATAAAMGLSGGATSPARFLLLFALVYPSSFYPPWEARPYLVAVVATWASPLLYDPEALRHGVLGELVIVVPAFWMLGFLMVEGQRQMVSLRAQADDLARRDPLTGLANRRALMEAVERHAGSRRAGDRLGLLLLDVDDFKSVNTRFGHPGGDGALVAVAAALRRAAREEDVA